jgi:hypothetical protein
VAVMKKADDVPSSPSPMTGKGKVRVNFGDDSFYAAETPRNGYIPPPDLPDFKAINRLPILEVAKMIGLGIDDEERILCWRSNEHKPGRRPFLRITDSNKAVCGACNNYETSVLDMVNEVGGFNSLLEAAEFVALVCEVPRIAKGSHLNNPNGELIPPALKNPMSLLIKTGIYGGVDEIWRGLSESTKSLIPILLDFAEWNEDRTEGTLRLSYRAMQRYSGLASPNAISRAILELERISWLQRVLSLQPRKKITREVGLYRLTPFSIAVRGLADAIAPHFGNAIKTEKAERRRQREEHEQQLRSKRK